MPGGDVEALKPGGQPAEIDYDLLRKCAAQYLPGTATATFLNISYATFKRRLKDDERFIAAWEEGRASAQKNLRMLQWRHANGKGPAAVMMTKHMSAHILGETEKSVIEHANKDGKPLEISATQHTHALGIDLRKATDEELAALAVLAAAQERMAAENARDITEQVTEL